MGTAALGSGCLLTDDLNVGVNVETPMGQALRGGGFCCA
jgi:hypothetical protein